MSSGIAFLELAFWACLLELLFGIGLLGLSSRIAFGAGMADPSAWRLIGVDGMFGNGGLIGAGGRSWSSTNALFRPGN